MAISRFVWDRNNLLAETSEDGTVQAMHTNVPRRYGRLISTRVAGTSFYFHFDAAHSARVLTNSVQTTIDSWTYSAWGDVVARTGVDIVAMTWCGELGYYFDIAINAYHVKRRSYSPTIGRWTAYDAALFRDGPDRYIYVHNRPLRDFDPSGMITAVFSRPTDDEHEFLDEVDYFDIVTPGWNVQPPANAPHTPWETSRITVTVTADTSDCSWTKCEVIETGNPVAFPLCTGKIKVIFEYSATLTSLNPASRDNPATAGSGFGVEVQGSGLFYDTYVPFTVTPGKGPGPIGTTFSTKIMSDFSCYGWIDQTYTIRNNVILYALLGIADHSIRYKRTGNGCEKEGTEALSGEMTRSGANGPLRQIPPDSAYPPSPFYYTP